MKQAPKKKRSSLQQGDERVIFMRDHSAGKVSDDYDVSSRDTNVSSLSSSSIKEQSDGNALTYNEYEKEMINKRKIPPHHNDVMIL